MSDDNPAGDPSLVINDSDNIASPFATYSLSSYSLSRQDPVIVGTGSSLATVSFNRMSSVTLNTGLGVNQINVESKLPDTVTTINAAIGTNIFRWPPLLRIWISSTGFSRSTAVAPGTTAWSSMPAQVLSAPRPARGRFGPDRSTVPRDRQLHRHAPYASRIVPVQQPDRDDPRGTGESAIRRSGAVQRLRVARIASEIPGSGSPEIFQILSLELPIVNIFDDLASLNINVAGVGETFDVYDTPSNFVTSLAMGDDGYMTVHGTTGPLIVRAAGIDAGTINVGDTTNRIDSIQGPTDGQPRTAVRRSSSTIRAPWRSPLIRSPPAPSAELAQPRSPMPS